MRYKTIEDSEFDRVVTLRDAYRIMEHFATAHHNRGETTTLHFLAYFGLRLDGISGDPAALPDFLKSVSAVVGAPG